VYPLTVARKKLGKNVTAATNTHATIEEFVGGVVFYVVHVVSRKVESKRLVLPRGSYYVMILTCILMGHEYTDILSFHFAYSLNNLLIEV
jgi:hypothetical protein